MTHIGLIATLIDYSPVDYNFSLVFGCENSWMTRMTKKLISNCTIEGNLKSVLKHPLRCDHCVVIAKHQDKQQFVILFGGRLQLSFCSPHIY